MANDSSLAGGAVQFAFDLETQKGVMSLLAAIRASELAPIERNELRDLVLSYTNGGRDNSVRITIQQKVLAHGIVPLVSTVPVPEVTGFGSSRPAPSFSVSTRTTVAQPAPTPAATPAPVTSTPAAPETPVPQVQPAPTPVSPSTTEAPVSTQAQAAVSSNLTPTPAATPAPVAPTPAAPEAPAPQVQPAPTTEPKVAPAPEAVIAPADTSVTGYNADAALQRIREIKSLVNDKVGNPVNLVNIDNVVGREYMAALLDAMKKINSGSSAITAMQRLEAAYQAVELTIKEHGTQPQRKMAEQKAEQKNISPAPAATPAPVAPTPAAPEAPAPQAQPTPTPEPKVAPAPVSEPAALASELSEAPTSVIEPESTHGEDVAPVSKDLVKNDEVMPEPKPAVINNQNAAARLEKIENSPSGYDLDISSSLKKPTPVKVDAPVGAPAPIPGKRSEEEIESAWGPATDTLKPTVSVQLGEGSKAKSLADAKDKLRSPDELLSPADIASSSVSGDPLFTKEVDDGLQQLLSEWSLFKKSGLFGTGAKGREHPLFKKISSLQIPLLLAGRFEGATQEIKQSITDYMNGWRYEQGIIYEQGETFEHYLRRVIRHIIDLQKKKHQP